MLCLSNDWQRLYHWDGTSQVGNLEYSLSLEKIKNIFFRNCFVLKLWNDWKIIIFETMKMNYVKFSMS